MATVHLFIGSKGGIGKTFAAAMLIQALIHHGIKPLCYDLDPCTQGLHLIKTLPKKELQVIEDGRINGVLFDGMIENIRNSAEDDIFILDTGSSSFLTLYEYLRSARLPKILEEMGHSFYFHSIIYAGTALPATCLYYEQCLHDFPENKHFVWINPHEAKPLINGQTFERSLLCTDYQDRIAGLVQIPVFTDWADWDLRTMWEEGLTMQEFIDTPGRNLSPCTRLAEVKRLIFMAIEAAGLIPERAEPAPEPETEPWTKPHEHASKEPKEAKEKGKDKK